MKFKDDIIFINNTREDWSNVLGFIKKGSKCSAIQVEITSEHMLHNLIYYLLIQKKYNDLGIELIINCTDKNNLNKICFEIYHLFFLVSKKIKESIEIIGIGRIASRFKDSDQLKFDTNLPFFFFNKENELLELTKVRSDFKDSFNSYNSKIMGSLINSEKPIEFIENYILRKLSEPKLSDEYRTFIIRASKELNFLALFILVYSIAHSTIALNELNDIKYSLRNFSNALYQIIENSYYHSFSHFSILYFSIILFVDETKSKSYAKLAEKQLHKIQKKVDFINEYNFDLNEDKNIFFLTLDDCDQEEGYTILDNSRAWCEEIEQNDFEVPHIEHNSLKSTFSFFINEQNNKWDEYKASSKYGIRTYINSSIALNMQSMINSGKYSLGIDPNCSLWKNGKKDLVLDDILVENNTKCNLFVTEYACCLPIKGINRNIEYDSNAIIAREMISSREILNYSAFSLRDFFDLYIVDFSTKGGCGRSKKDIVVEEITKNIIDNIKDRLIDSNEIIYTFHYNNGIVSSEILCKVLTNLITYHLESKHKFYLALNFIDVKNNNLLFYRISEFLYYYRISMNVLTKFNKKEELQSNVQIALSHFIKIKEVDGKIKGKYDYISTLVGINYSIIMQSFINNLLYNNGIDELNKFDLYIDDLNIFKYQKNSIENKKPISIDILPFELLPLNDNPPIFFKDIKKILEKEDLVKHKNVNVLLGSGLYLDTFYEAEFIFQNNYIIKRIAFLIKSDIEDYIDEKLPSNVVLVGYAAYSHMLCEEILKMLKKSYESKITFSTLYVQNVGELKISKTSKVKYNRKTDFIAIVPIGSTLNTFLKMNLAVKKELSIDNINLYIFKKNYCVITVSPSDEYQNEYWKKEKESYTNNFETLRLNFKDDNIKIYIRSLVNLETKWKNIDSKVNKQNKAISHVDRTSTIIKTIFKFEKDEKEIVLDKTEFEKFKILKNKVKYGHYSSNGNHHLFYINYKKIFEDESLKNKLIEFYENYNNLVNPSAYNIVISPLNSVNDLFLRIIIDKVFHNNLTLLQFDSKTTFRENFKNKYGFVTKRIENIYEKSRNSIVNIYFVDNTIISGRTFNRAKELINSLVIDSEVIKDRIPSRIFTKTILFVNRSSKNTLSSLMDDYQNVVYYLDVKCPCFDTHSGICPDCNITRNYEKLSFICVEDRIKKLLQIKSNNHKVKPVDYIKPDSYKDEDFLRLYFTHYILNNKEKINALFKKSDEDIFVNMERLFECCYQITQEIEINQENSKDNKLLQKEIFIKIISRPFVTLYENIKQVCLKYLILEFEKNFLEGDIGYQQILITRISYMGSRYLNNQKDKLAYLKKKNLNNEEFCEAIDKSLYWEDAYYRGIIQ